MFQSNCIKKPIQLIMIKVFVCVSSKKQRFFKTLKFQISDIFINEKRNNFLNIEKKMSLFWPKTVCVTFSQIQNYVSLKNPLVGYHFILWNFSLSGGGGNGPPLWICYWLDRGVSNYGIHFFKTSSWLF